MESMNWKSFKAQLQANISLQLQFQYAENQWVNAAYHITEIKQAPITSVDCGGVVNRWTEIIVQLWEPEAKAQEEPMQISKALSIIDLVEKALPLEPEAVVKIEFGNNSFDTRQMLPKSFYTTGNNLVVDLRPDTVQCKAIERGGSCGTTASGEEYCTTETVAKPKIALKTIAAAPVTCTPGSGCC